MKPSVSISDTAVVLTQTLILGQAVKSQLTLFGNQAYDNSEARQMISVAVQQLVESAGWLALMYINSKFANATSADSSMLQPDALV